MAIFKPRFHLLTRFFCAGRLNEAPVSGYGKDVGTKTTMRITYPEGAIQKPENYEKDSLFVFSAFKPLDFKWLRQMVYKEKLVRIFLTHYGMKVKILSILTHTQPRRIPTKISELRPITAITADL